MEAPGEVTLLGEALHSVVHYGGSLRVEVHHGEVHRGESRFVGVGHNNLAYEVRRSEVRHCGSRALSLESATVVAILLEAFVSTVTTRFAPVSA